MGDEGNIFSFGYNQYGQLGLGDYNSRDTATKMPDIKVKHVTAKKNRTFIIGINNGLLGCGENYYCELGLVHYDNVSKLIKMTIKMDLNNVEDFRQKIVTGDHHTVVIDRNGQVFGSGRDGDGQLGLNKNYNSTTEFVPLKWNNKDIIARQVAAGSYHTIIVQ